jgi:hypothetical protein
LERARCRCRTHAKTENLNVGPPRGGSRN